MVETKRSKPKTSEKDVVDDHAIYDDEEKRLEKWKLGRKNFA